MGHECIAMGMHEDIASKQLCGMDCFLVQPSIGGAKLQSCALYHCARYSQAIAQDAFAFPFALALGAGGRVIFSATKIVCSGRGALFPSTGMWNPST